LSITGVLKVDQGWISPKDEPTFSEAVIVEFDPKIIALNNLVGIHLHSHSCTAVHRMRSKYRSAIYLMHDKQQLPVINAINEYQQDFEAQIITEVVPFGQFRLNSENYLNYYFKHPEKPFCENIVNPKLRELIARYSHLVDKQKIFHLL
jgi:peptide-methionine (S)-S-oxide reductase